MIWVLTLGVLLILFGALILRLHQTRYPTIEEVSAELGLNIACPAGVSWCGGPGGRSPVCNACD